MTKPSAFLRVAFAGDGSPHVTVVMTLGGTEVEAVLEGCNSFQLLGVPGHSCLDMRFYPQHVEFVGREEEAASEATAAQEPNQARSH